MLGGYTEILFIKMCYRNIQIRLKFQNALAPYNQISLENISS